MRPLPFTLLCVAWLVVLLGILQVLPVWIDAEARAAAEATPREAAMAVPPKPLGAEPDLPAGPGSGSGGQARLTEATCAAMASGVRDVCWQALARQGATRDPEGALLICKKVTDGELEQECEADVAETVAPQDRAFSERVCVGIPTIKWRGQCHFGIGLALAEIDARYAMGRCDHAEAFLRFCRHDVVGEVALEDTPAAIALCAEEQGDTLTRSTCWHGIGKYLARRDVNEARAACDVSTESWRNNCYHGLGWGGAERDPDATLAACGSMGAYADSCRQGVAHQLKRGDPARAIALCESIGTDWIRERCLNFVRR